MHAGIEIFLLEPSTDHLVALNLRHQGFAYGALLLQIQTPATTNPRIGSCTAPYPFNTINLILIICVADKARNFNMPTKQMWELGSSVILNQTYQPLEFVTITNPAEIKNPAKQKAIRRHARRRENDSTSSRKPLKIVFDLPEADMQMGIELSRARHQTLERYYPAAKYVHPQLKPAGISLDFIHPLSVGREMIFPPPFSLNRNPRAMQLIDFSKCSSQGLNPPLKSLRHGGPGR